MEGDEKDKSFRGELGFICFDKGTIRIKKNISPISLVVLSFLGIILLGGLLLMLPVSSNGEPTSIVDALFTSTSATCVTGLVVKDTATHFSFFGQLVILLLIQFGGLGYMTITTFFALLLGKRLGVNTRLALKENLNMSNMAGMFKLARRVFFFVMTIEGIGALILFLRWLSLGKDTITALKYGIFHSVSAFNNAGFDIMGGGFKSLTDYASDPVILLTVAGLIIAGGLGFIVLSNLYEVVNLKKGIHKRINLQTKIVIIMTISLLIVGSLLLFAFESSNPDTMKSMSLRDKIMNSFFQSTSARTAGFNSINIGKMTTDGLLTLIFLMFVGASPGGTGGGIKTVTFIVVLAAILSYLRGKKETEIHDRSIDDGLVMKAMSIFILSLMLIIIITFALCAFNNFTFMQNLFETTSAFGTVGLSTGITPMLDVFSKITVSLAVFIGRVGILSFILSLYTTKYINKVRLPREELSVG